MWAEDTVPTERDNRGAILLAMEANGSDTPESSALQGLGASEMASDVGNPSLLGLSEQVG